MIRDIRVGALILFVQRIHQLIVWIDLHYTLQAESVTVHRIFPSFKGTLNQDFDWDSKVLQYTHKWCSNILWEETSIFLHLTNNMKGWRSFSIHVIMWPVSWSINQAMRVPSPNSGPDEVVQRLSRLYGAAGRDGWPVLFVGPEILKVWRASKLLKPWKSPCSFFGDALAIQARQL